MELTRRDALAALASGGVVVGSGAAALSRADLREAEETVEATVDVETLVAVAEVVYPSEVANVESFVRTYVAGRTQDRPDYRAGVAEGLQAIDDTARDWYDDAYADLDRDQRDSLLREMGVDAIDPDPAGSTAARIRYYVVNELLYAFYTSPTGGELAGTENPIGHPGGTESYQRGPE
ncbi:gluconate 2-dehydrogenase subunit 3 family protein [Haloarchaeobius amylolyticus]|uniref:gluconate 2-dehydrogenase subunit 3 family protein n=1 Tax=Haloarchaeobius amylolyticus TaxID=1198296 RepID=UPI002270B3C4|nr:gluconate 2-dehydrogenase subunit 3 family protein [Haloarchaeobius amylolyticus]